MQGTSAQKGLRFNNSLAPWKNYYNLFTRSLANFSFLFNIRVHFMYFMYSRLGPKKIARKSQQIFSPQECSTKKWVAWKSHKQIGLHKNLLKDRLSLPLFDRDLYGCTNVAFLIGSHKSLNRCHFSLARSDQKPKSGHILSSGCFGLGP